MSVLVIELEKLRGGSCRNSGAVDPVELQFADPAELVFEGPLELDVRVSTTDRLSFYVHGTLSYRVSAECRRCLRPVSVERNPEVRGMFAFNEALERLELNDEERELQDIIPLAADSDSLDLTSLVREAVVLDYPHFLLCSESCRGLCPGCGADLNVEACRCHHESDDPRWAKLLGLKKKEDK
ncbi:DUF177 domain-containing protein [bacterium]|nr:DUF177 domain-containing protein [bacterium]